MKRLAIPLVAVMAMTLAPAAQAAEVPSGTYRGEVKSGLLKGTWLMTFYRNGARFKVKSRFGTSIGRTRFKGSTVLFDRESGLEAVCHNKAGRYRFKLTRTTLKLTPIRDPCRPRQKANSPLYRKVS